MNKLSIFQIVVVGIFSFFIVAGFLALYLTKNNDKGPGGSKPVSVVIWGTEPTSRIQEMFDTLDLEKRGYIVNYVQKKNNQFNQDVLEALASGNGPDGFILSNDLLLKYQDKIVSIPYTSYSSDSLKKQYVVAGEIVRSKNGLLGIPFGLDPLIMYWNRNYFASAGLSTPPRYWDEFFKLAENLTVKELDGLQIKRSAVSIGNFENTNNAKEIFSAMLMQVGQYPLALSSEGVVYKPNSRNGAIPVTDFYSSFADFKKPNFTWSKNLANSLNLFAYGDLAVYFGFASDYKKIKSLNPNLDFGVYYFPQPRDSKNFITFGKVLVLATSKWSLKANSVISLSYLLGSEGTEVWGKITNTPPITRSGLNKRPTDNFGQVIYDSALWARNWPDPNPKITNDIMGSIISNVSSGWQRTADAWNKADQRFSNLLVH